MRFFDIGPRAEGFIAIGQEAVGVIAIGQLALGFVAIGQLARGVFVVGQLAVGVFAVGQLAVGLWAGVGMIAVGGRWTKGIGYAIWPRPGGPPLPKTISLAEVCGGQPGFVRLGVRPAEAGVEGPGLVLTHDGESLEADLSPAAVEALRAVVLGAYPRALVRLEQKQKMLPADRAAYRDVAPTADYLEASKVVPLPAPPRTEEGFWWKTSARAFATLLAVLLWVAIVAVPFYGAVVGTDTWP